MKLFKRKTRKAMEKIVRKALKKHGPTLVAGLASALAASATTLAETQAPGKRGKSNLALLADKAEESLTKHGRKRPQLPSEKKRTRAAESTVS